MTTPPFDPKYTVYKTVGGSSRIGQNNQTRFFPLSDRELVVEICFGDCLCTLWPHTLLGAQLFILPLHFREETSKVIQAKESCIFVVISLSKPCRSNDIKVEKYRVCIIKHRIITLCPYCQVKTILLPTLDTVLLWGLSSQHQCSTIGKWFMF